MRPFTSRRPPCISIVSPGMPTIRLTSRRPSSGDGKMTTSPRSGSLRQDNRQPTNGTRQSKAVLSMKIRSPSRIVGRMDGVGTSFQSATADRKLLSNTTASRIGLPHSCQSVLKRPLGRSDMSGLSGLGDLSGEVRGWEGMRWVQGGDGMAGCALAPRADEAQGPARTGAADGATARGIGPRNDPGAASGPCGATLGEPERTLSASAN